MTRRTLLNIMFPALHQTASMKHVSARQPGDEFHFIWIIARLRPRSIQRALTHRAIALTVRIPRRLHAPRGFHHQSSSAARRLGRGEQQSVPNRIRQHFRRLLARRAPDRRSRERRRRRKYAITLARRRRRRRRRRRAHDIRHFAVDSKTKAPRSRTNRAPLARSSRPFRRVEARAERAVTRVTFADRVSRGTGRRRRRGLTRASRPGRRV